MKSDVLIGAVLDRSGSMGGAESGVIGGFNEFRREQAGVDGNAYLTLTLFDDRVEQPYVAWNCRDIPDIDHRTYFVRGSTALNDAFVTQIEQMEGWLRANPWFTGKKVVLVITDGHENASSRFPNGSRNNNTWYYDGFGRRIQNNGWFSAHSNQYFNAQVQEISQRKKREGWEFVVFGANVNAQQIAAQLGIDADRAHQFTADARDSAQVFGAYSMATVASRGGDNHAYTATLSSIRSDQAASGTISGPVSSAYPSTGSLSISGPIASAFASGADGSPVASSKPSPAKPKRKVKRSPQRKQLD